MEEKILSVLETIHLEVKGLGQDVSEIKDEQYEMKRDVKNVKQNQVEMKQDIKNIQEEQKGMKQDIKNIQEEQKGMKQDIKNLQKGQTTLKKEMKQMKKEQTIMKNKQETIIENIETIKERQRIDGINIAKILEKQNETFALLFKENKENKQSGGNVTKNKKIHQIWSYLNNYQNNIWINRLRISKKSKKYRIGIEILFNSNYESKATKTIAKISI